MIPADAVLMKGDANLDYSFVSGENTPLQKRKGELIYAGAKQKGSVIELEVVNETSQSYITQLWNNDVFSNKKNGEKSFIHPWSRYFTLALFSVAIAAAVYWWFNDTSKILPAVTSVLIVACPCSLLLTATFTYGNMLRIFGKNKLYLKNASVIEAMANIDSIVFDKTGTLTHNHTAAVAYEGTPLTAKELYAVRAVAKQSSHPLSKAIAASIEENKSIHLPITNFREYTGKGIQALVNGIPVKMGSAHFINEEETVLPTYESGPHVQVVLNNIHMGRFTIANQYKEGLKEMSVNLQQKEYDQFILSGDNKAEKKNLENLFTTGTKIKFEQQPQQKLEYIKQLQQQHKQVLKIFYNLE